jgi:hypothetical protein
MAKFALLMMVVLALCVGWGEAKPSKAPWTPKPSKLPTPAASEGVDKNGKDWMQKRACGGYNKTSTGELRPVAACLCPA